MASLHSLNEQQDNPEPGNDASAQEQLQTRDLLYGEADLSKQANLTKPADTRVDSCPDSKAYLELLNGALKSFYEPERLSSEQIASLRTKYNCSIKTDADAVKYADEALKAFGDPYTDVIPASEAKEIERAEKGETTGIGVELSARPKKDAQGQAQVTDAPATSSPIIIRRVIDGTPAQLAGLKAGEQIVKVNDEPIDTETAEETAKLIRGDIDTKVRLTVGKNGENRELELTRQKIDTPAVKSEMRDGFLHLQVTTFSQIDTSEEVEKAIKENPDAKGYILDLRNNRGGYVREALQTGSLLMSSGTMLSTRERADVDGKVNFDISTYQLEGDGIRMISVQEDKPGSEKFNKTIFDRHKDLVDKPVVVLVNEHSASASELLTGALKDNNEAYVIGTRTYGKGIGQNQTRSNLPEGSWLKVTTFKYFTPNGTWVGDAASNKIGLTPHLVVPLEENAELNSSADNQLQAALDHLKIATAPKEANP
ncbi:MAG: PDZ domain-containing protein, partial [Candidatus Competibacteraceae bacterium]|nr:PDZ domain-containing protein [Candidatus Competibacteraceae bacterium]